MKVVSILTCWPGWKRCTWLTKLSLQREAASVSEYMCECQWHCLSSCWLFGVATVEGGIRACNGAICVTSNVPCTIRYFIFFLVCSLLYAWQQVTWLGWSDAGGCMWVGVHVGRCVGGRERGLWGGAEEWKEGLLGVLLVAWHTDSSTPSAACSQSALCQRASGWWTASTLRRRGTEEPWGGASGEAGSQINQEFVSACVSIGFSVPAVYIWFARCSNLSRRCFFFFPRNLAAFTTLDLCNVRSVPCSTGHI